MRLLLACCAVLAACRGGDGDAEGAGAAAALPAPAAPSGAVIVAAGLPLQPSIDAAAPGAVLWLEPGDHAGPAVIARPLQLLGTRAAVVSSPGRGTTIDVRADGVVLRGFTVAGSGDRLDQQDGGVRVRGSDVTVAGLRIDGVLFGIQVEQSARVQLLGNRVRGTAEPALGLRGDGIRLWETRDSVVRDNDVDRCRDLVVWYSSHNRLAGNVVRNCRYGTHFMYSHGNDVANNRYVDDVVGVFVMYSHDLTLRRNVLARAGGAAGIGLGLKESGNLVVEDNWILACATGIYLDTAPLDLAHENRFACNTVRLCETAVAFHASAPRNEFTGNDFRDNGAVVAVGGDGDALGCAFHGNHYDTYRGYDLDGDGVGDVPFVFRRLSSQLESRCAELALLHGAPAMAMVDLVGELMPLFAPRELLRDPAPAMQAGPRWTPEDHDAR
jgi:nitrous oxidase accessory protein